MIIISAPHFVAGLELNKENVCINAAPIIKYMIGWDAMRIIEYCKKKGWSVESNK